MATRADGTSEAADRADRPQIAELYLRWADAVSSRRLDRLGDLLTPDAALVLPGLETATGPEAIARVQRELMDGFYPFPADLEGAGR